MKMRKTVYRPMTSTVRGQESSASYHANRMVQLKDGMVISYAEYIKNPRMWNEQE